jgi:hypothetical protein
MHSTRFPGQRQMKPEHLEITQLKREKFRLKAERDILRNCNGPLPGAIVYRAGIYCPPRV